MNFILKWLKSNHKTPYSESLRIGVLLALTGGFLDAYSFLCRGKVFANAQTGNMILLSISLLNGEFNEIIKYIIPILAFAIGIIIVKVFENKFATLEKIHWRQYILILEIVLILILAFIPNNYIANTIISFICALQVQSFKKFHGYPYATTMCTGNLRSGTEHLYSYIKDKNKESLKIFIQYYFIIFIFCFGAFIGGFITIKLGKLSIIFSAIPLLIILFIIGYNQQKEY